MDTARFRTDFPEFSSTTMFPDSQVTFWGDIAEELVAVDRFGNLRVQAVELFAAHSLVLAAQSQSASATGAIPSGNAGAVSSKAVGSTNLSYDSSAMELNAGHWNQTTYGRQYIRLARLMGAGCVQL